MTRVLHPHHERDWSVPAGTLTWSCWTTAAHVAHDLLAYAGLLATAVDAAPTEARPCGSAREAHLPAPVSCSPRCGTNSAPPVTPCTAAPWRTTSPTCRTPPRRSWPGTNVLWPPCPT
ncbi:hypothetical protein [Micromonospora zamorensis]|uniref:hypothetical protein n=1 Tax=Micromonospora zamorensis TaxID=709883 RepID=UPI0037B9EFC7